jgi:segregation and condensation protein B
MGATSHAAEVSAERPGFSDGGGASEDAEELEPGDPDPRQVTPQRIVEAMLFVGTADGRPLTAQEMSAAIRDVEADEIDAMVSRLNQLYARHDAACVIEADGAGYRLRLRPDLDARRLELQGRRRTASLSPAAIEILSIIAYHPGIGAREIDRLRGARSQRVVSQLVRRELLHVDWQSREPSTARYFTTERFNRLVGIGELSQLPDLTELDDHQEGP